MTGMTRPRRLASAATLLVALACTPVERAQPGHVAATDEVACAAEPTVADPTARVIATLQTRDHEVMIASGASGVRFTISAVDGTVLAERLTETEFEHGFPALFQRYDAAFAEDRAGWVDASADVADVQAVLAP